MKLQEEEIQLTKVQKVENQFDHRISISESEKTMKNEKNYVYKFFSKSSSAIDSKLFNYRRHFEDLNNNRVYGNSAELQPFSFNIPNDSIFGSDEEVLKDYLKNFNQMRNYEKLYGDLRGKKLRKEVERVRKKFKAI